MPMPKARARTISALAQAVASGEVALDRSADRNELRERLLAVPGIGPWTCDYIAMRALGDPDVLLVGDAGTRHGALALGVDVLHTQEAWRPWRSYAQMHVWEAA
jgi:AraC family transcriptional regulator of adaptative response / DNA-3-methyladenine glycosylase II